MPRRPARAAAIAATALLVTTLGACGEDSATAGGDASSTPSETPASATSPTTAAQPEGTHGVTLEIDNWSDYSDDPVVLAWKKTMEAFYGSVNAREPNAEFLRRTAGEQRRLWVGNINYAREHDLVGAATLKGRVERVSIRGAKAVLVACDLRQTTNFRARGEAYTGSERGWHRMRNTFKRQGKGARQLWVMTDSAPRGRCSKGS